MPVIGLNLYEKHTIHLNESKTLSVDVHLFDANHCPGSVMFLFTGYMGTILETGDMRFSMRMFEENPILYPPQLRTADYAKCSIHVDELIYDNTFCDPIFKFPPRVSIVVHVMR
jgi:DNA cross-link repair 1B protein